MKRSIALFLILLLISVSLTAENNCSMMGYCSKCNDKLHMKTESKQNPEKCCSISSDGYNEKVPLHIQNDYIPFLYTKSYEYNYIAYFQNFSPVHYELTYAFPPPLKNIKLLI